MADGNYTAAVAGEIRAEMARQRKTGVQLAKVLRRTQNTAHNKLQGRSPFSLEELAIATEWLNVPMGRLIEAARDAVLVAKSTPSNHSERES